MEFEFCAIQGISCSFYTLPRKKVTFNLSIFCSAPGSQTPTYSLDNSGKWSFFLGRVDLVWLPRTQNRPKVKVEYAQGCIFWWPANRLLVFESRALGLFLLGPLHFTALGCNDLIEFYWDLGTSGND